MPATAVFAAGLKKDGDTTGPEAELELPPRAAGRAERTVAGLPYFVGRTVPGFMSYAPDGPRLEGLSDRLVIAGGQDSRGELRRRRSGEVTRSWDVQTVLTVSRSYETWTRGAAAVRVRGESPHRWSGGGRALLGRTGRAEGGGVQPPGVTSSPPRPTYTVSKTGRCLRSVRPL